MPQRLVDAVAACLGSFDAARFAPKWRRPRASPRNMTVTVSFGLAARRRWKLMTGERTTVTPLGWRVYGLGVMALGMVCLAWGDFDPGQPAPKDIPDRIVLAYVAAAFMFVAGAAIEWRRTAAWAAA